METWAELLELANGPLTALVRASLCIKALELEHDTLTAIAIKNERGDDLPRRVCELARTSDMTPAEYSRVILANRNIQNDRTRVRQSDEALRRSFEDLASIFSQNWRVRRIAGRIELDALALARLREDTLYQQSLQADVSLLVGAIDIHYKKFALTLQALTQNRIRGSSQDLLSAYAEQYGMSGGEFSYYARALTARRSSGKSSHYEISKADAIEAITAFGVFCYRYESPASAESSHCVQLCADVTPYATLSVATFQSSAETGRNPPKATTTAPQMRVSAQVVANSDDVRSRSPSNTTTVPRSSPTAQPSLPLRYPSRRSSLASKRGIAAQVGLAVAVTAGSAGWKLWTHESQLTIVKSRNDERPVPVPPPLAQRTKYLEAGQKVVTRDNTGASTPLLILMKKACGGLEIRHAEADGVELSCTNGFFPEDVPPRWPLVAHRPYYCPYWGDEIDASRSRQRFCSNLVSKKRGTGRKPTDRRLRNAP